MSPVLRRVSGSLSVLLVLASAQRAPAEDVFCEIPFSKLKITGRSTAKSHSGSGNPATRR